MTKTNLDDELGNSGRYFRVALVMLVILDDILISSCCGKILFTQGGVGLSLSKLNVFIWQILPDRIPNRENLLKRNNDVPSILCPLCNVCSLQV